MTQVLDPKQPTETVAYYIDWSRQLLTDTIVSYTLAVTSGTVTITADENGAQFIRMVVAGGADGEVATFSCQIVTYDEQRLDRDLSLVIADAATAITPATTTKRTIVNMAFEEIGLAGYEFDASPQEQFSVLRRLDALMADWKSQSLNLGYNAPPTIGAGDLDDESGIPDNALNTVVMSLALRAMPAIGKSMSPETRVALAQGMGALRTAYAVIPGRTLPRSTPRGSGNKPSSTWWPFAGTYGDAP